jgi:hypothetical protein
MDKEAIARQFLYATGIFDNRAEIAANPDHQFVKWANTAATHILDEHEVVPKGDFAKLHSALDEADALIAELIGLASLGPVAYPTGSDKSTAVRKWKDRSVLRASVEPRPEKLIPQQDQRGSL